MSEPAQIEEVDATEADRLQRQGAVLVDVREDDEWAAGRAPGALHIPLAQVGGAGADFAGRDVLVICRSGGRSTQAAQILTASGVTVRNVVGGMTSWASAGLPVVRDDGSPGAIA